MKREIKFRAWHNGNNFILDNAHIYDDFNEMIVSNGNTYSLMQFTGLLDKNGKEVYESDIVEFYYNDKKTLGEIIFHNSKATYGIKGKGYFLSFAWLNSIELYDYEVIGNIHQNKDLTPKQ